MAGARAGGGRGGGSAIGVILAHEKVVNTRGFVWYRRLGAICCMHIIVIVGPYSYLGRDLEGTGRFKQNLFFFVWFTCLACVVS